jgi:hypothetical protein
MHRPRSTPYKHYFFWYPFRLEAEGLVQSEELGKLKQFIHLIGSATYDLPTYSIVP